MRELTKKEIIYILHLELQPATDKGSTQAVIDTKDFAKAADRILELIKRKNKDGKQ